MPMVLCSLIIIFLYYLFIFYLYWLYLYWSYELTRPPKLKRHIALSILSHLAELNALATSSANTAQSLL
jgi:uncharacterized membrane protein YesL